jgi:hypothetical protein
MVILNSITIELNSKFNDNSKKQEDFAEYNINLGL